MKTELEKAYGDVSPRFHDRVERTLDEIILRGELPVKRYAYKTAIIALAALLALTGAALAVGNALGLLDFFTANNDLNPGDGARESIVAEICSEEAGRMRYTLREAVYDGASVRALIEVIPLEPELYVVNYIGASGGGNPFESANPFEYFDAGRQLAESTGRAPLITGYPNLDYNKDTEEYMRLVMGAGFASAYRDGDTLLIYTETTIAAIDGNDTPDELMLRFEMIAGDYDNFVSLPFTLKKCALNRAEYAPTQDNIPNIAITGVSITQTPFADYLNVKYEYVSRIELLDYQPGTVYYGTPPGINVHTDPVCSGMKNARPMTQEEARSTRKQLCPVCAGGANALADIENWAFTREDAQSRLFATTREIDRESIDADKYTYTQTWIYQQGEALPDALALSAQYKGEPSGITINCARIAE